MFKKKILQLLNSLKTYYKLEKDVFRSRAYENAFSSVKYMTQVKSIEDFRGISGISEKGSIFDKIRRIFDGESINDILTEEQLKTIKAVDELSKIYDIGTNKAYKIVKDYKIYTISDLKKQLINPKLKDEFTQTQLISIKHYYDLKHKIPHAEITKIINLFIKYNLRNRYVSSIEGVGSYRREKRNSGDIDILLIVPKFTLNSKNIIPDLINYITRNNKHIKFIKLKGTSINADIKKIQSYNYEYLIKTQFSKYWRKLDIKLFKKSDYAASLLYFTGNKQFNLYMRSLAKKKGYLLNGNGLFKLNNKINKRVLTPTETSIFKLLGMKYIPPNKREII